jgi:hypothetical protein
MAPPPAYAPPPFAPAPPAAAGGVVDPNGLGVALDRLGSNDRKVARSAALVAGVLLDEDERVEAAVGGKVEGHGAVVLLTDRRLVLVDDRAWRPQVHRIELTPALTVAGWQDDRTASLTFQWDGRQVVLDQIRDRALAVEMAQRIRYRTGVAG